MRWTNTSRLAALNRPQDALRVYRTEIDRNPNDQGLYERLASFLEQDGMAREVESTYTQAIAKFADRSLYHKLARWYLRRRESAALEKISRYAIAVFTGSELEQYFGEIVSSHPDAVFYRQLNLYAHARFPEDLVFVHNLLNAYARPETRDNAARQRLLGEYWFYDDQLRRMLFEQLAAGAALSRTGRDPHYQSTCRERTVRPGSAPTRLPSSSRPRPKPGSRILSRRHPPRVHWPLHTRAATNSPGRRRHSTVRSQRTIRATPISPCRCRLASRAPIRAKRASLPGWATSWPIASSSPVHASIGNACRPPSPESGSLPDAATVYWDYYRYNDALRWIAAARKFDDPPASPGRRAIYEGKRDYANAVREYVAGALDGQSAASNRVIRLLNRPQSRDLVERATAAAVAIDASDQAVALRISVLEAQQRRQDIETVLSARVEAEKSPAGLTSLQETARRLGFDIEARANQRYGR